MCGVLAEGYMIRKIASRNRCSRSVPLLRNASWQQRLQSITEQGAEFHSNWLGLRCSGCSSCFSTSSGKPKRASSLINKEANLSGFPTMLRSRRPKGRGSKIGAAAVHEGQALRAGDREPDKTSGAQLVLLQHGNAPSMPRIDRQWAER